MSNDLISRSAVMELIESRFVDGCLEIGDKTLIEGYDLLDDVSDLPTAYDADEVALAMEKQDPYKITYKNGFGHCKCGCEFESEGYSGEEYCPECGQKVWVGGYNGEENKIVSLAEVEHE